MIRNHIKACRWPALLVAAAGCAALDAQAAVPGITGNTFNLVAADAYTSQPDGSTLYSWGYGCAAGSTPTFLPQNSKAAANCPLMQMPGPTLIVTQGQPVTVTLTNQLPAAAGNTSIVFPGFSVTAAPAASQPGNCAAAAPAPVGLLATEAARNCSVTYTFTPANAGTYAYYSGSQSELQIEMGLFGAVIVLPAHAPTCAHPGKGDYALASAAYDNAGACYDREYLFQFSEADARVHAAVDDQKNNAPGSLNVPMDPYQPQFFMVNGRSMPDDMDGPYAAAYAHQPYNGNPHMHPGDLVLMRIIGQGRIQHPFHFHGNHARVLARDGNLLLAPDGTSLAGPLLFTTPTVPGQSQDQIFTWTGQGLNWDVYGLNQGHTCNGLAATVNTSATNVTQVNKFTAKGSTYDPTSGPGTAQPAMPAFDPVTKEWCPDHGKPMPVAPPDPQAVANGLWYGGTPYLGMQSANPLPLPPTAIIQNPDAGYAYMWHSHNEREITTNNVFPGGLMMMLIIDPPTSPINETL